MNPRGLCPGKGKLYPFYTYPENSVWGDFIQGDYVHGDFVHFPSVQRI